jgi:hypothetical protein
MELDDLKSAWKAMPAPTAAQQALLAITARSAAAASLRPLERGIAVELGFNVVLVLLFGSFLGDHFNAPKFAIPAAIALAFAVILCNLGVRQLVELRSVDRGDSIVSMQRYLERLEILRIRTTVGTLIFAPLLWLPIAIVAGKALFGLDLYALGVPYLAANALFGLAVLAGGFFVARATAARGAASRRVARLAADLSGSSLRRTAASLAALRTFEDEAA